MSRLAVVLFNLGGPDDQASVEPFLKNLFSDPAIISLPGLIRKPLAGLISKRRGDSARANYALMGGGSPLLPETRKQAAALETALTNARPGEETRVFIAMRYWRPLTEETAKAVADYAPDEIVLLPLYPQFSTTTTGSSLAAWKRAYKGPGVSRAVCCYPNQDDLAAAHAQRIRDAYAAAGSPKPARLLFSAHGLPEKVIAAGDPYQVQIEASAAAVAAKLFDLFSDWTICYQSRVGPLKWIGPPTGEAIAKAGAEGVIPVVAPIAFVSEHVETLVELDHEYAELAHAAGCAGYIRAPALGVQDAFIQGLVKAVSGARAKAAGVIAPASDWTCPKAARQCPRSEGAAA